MRSSPTLQPPFTLGQGSLQTIHQIRHSRLYISSWSAFSLSGSQYSPTRTSGTAVRPCGRRSGSCKPQTHRHLKCKPFPVIKKAPPKCSNPKQTNVSHVMIKIETTVPCRTSPGRAALLCPGLFSMFFVIIGVHVWRHRRRTDIDYEETGDSLHSPASLPLQKCHKNLLF